MLECPMDLGLGDQPHYCPLVKSGLRSEWTADKARNCLKCWLRDDEPDDRTVCWICGEKAVSWDNDFDFEDCCYDGEGIVHYLHCNNCGATIEIDEPIEGGMEN